MFQIFLNSHFVNFEFYYKILLTFFNQINKSIEKIETDENLKHEVTFSVNTSYISKNLY